MILYVELISILYVLRKEKTGKKGIKSGEKNISRKRKKKKEKSGEKNISRNVKKKYRKE